MLKLPSFSNELLALNKNLVAVKDMFESIQASIKFDGFMVGYLGYSENEKLAKVVHFKSKNWPTKKQLYAFRTKARKLLKESL